MGEKKIESIWDKEDVATYLKVEPRTIEDWVYQNKIPSIKMGGKRRFNKEDIDRWLKKNTIFPK